jgi:pyruvate dehydrogenase E1 component beta subunit
MRELSYAEAIREAMDIALERDPRVFLFGEDVGVYGGAFGVSDGLFQKYGPERVLDTPISEAGIAGVATGAALTGMKPIAEIQFMDFITLSMEQLVLQAAKLRFMLGGKVSVPFVMRTPAGAGTGAANIRKPELVCACTGAKSSACRRKRIVVVSIDDRIL